MGKLATLRDQLRKRALYIAPYVFDELALRLIGEEHDDQEVVEAKDLNDPIWKIVRLNSLEVALLDLPLFQRLRHVRQLGLAHLVYPTATHSRLDHSIGTMIAAKRMFEMIRQNSDSMPNDLMDNFAKITSFAALLHDVGHTAFSHCGEAALNSMLGSEFLEIQSVLADFFGEKPQRIAGKKPADPLFPEYKRPPSSELISVLLVLSPAMEKFIEKQSKPVAVDRFLLTAAALITGRGYQLDNDRHEYSFISSIISGDLDADKIDYVARDAYFSGVPISADVERLVSQLIAAPISKSTELENGTVDFKHLGNKTQFILSLRRAGISAFELFVMTRSYLFERIYSHQKIRAAERALENTLRGFLVTIRGDEKTNVSSMMNILFTPTGDDGVLHEMLRHEDFTAFASDTLLRRLPRRAIAINQRFTKDFNTDNQVSPSSIMIPFQQASKAAMEDAVSLENEVIERAGLSDDDDVIIDWPRFNPVNEDPQLYVWDPKEAHKLSKLSRYFNVQQLSNAYRDVKQIAWVFCAPRNRVAVGVVTALLFQEKFDILLGTEAFHRAKLAEKDVHNYLSNIKAPKGDKKTKIAIENLKNGFSDSRLIPSRGYLVSALSDLGAASGIVASRVEKTFVEIPFYRSFAGDLTAAMDVLGLLIRHAQSSIGEFKAPKPGATTSAKDKKKREAEFQQSILNFAKASKDIAYRFDVFEATKANGGFVDLIFRLKDQRVEIVVELKSELSECKKIFEKHAGQSAVYAADRFARVSILYAQYKSPHPVTIDQTIEIRKSAKVTNQLVFCVGQNAFGGIPSSRGATTTRIS